MATSYWGVDHGSEEVHKALSYEHQKQKLDRKRDRYDRRQAAQINFSQKVPEQKWDGNRNRPKNPITNAIWGAKIRRADRARNSWHKEWDNAPKAWADRYRKES